MSHFLTTLLATYMTAGNKNKDAKYIVVKLGIQENVAAITMIERREDDESQLVSLLRIRDSHERKYSLML